MKRFMPPQHNPRRTFLLVAIAVALMLLTKFVLWPGLIPGPKPKPVLPEAPAVAVVNSEVADFTSAQIVLDKMQPAGSLSNEINLFLPQPVPIPNKIPEAPPAVKKPAQAWKDFAVPAMPPSTLSKIVIIIDDMGMDRKHSREVIDLPAPITLAFLPYAPGVAEMAERGRAKGHELIIHAPMQPFDQNLDASEMVLTTSMSDSELRAMLGRMFDSFKGYIGINNHMGSKLTSDQRAMNIVMEELAKRGLIFVDSKTIGSSVAGSTAAAYGLDYAERDVFLDHENNIDFVIKSLYELESIAKRRGYAIAIGHPKAATIEGLKMWLPKAEARGFVVVPVSAVVHHKTPRVTQSAISSEAFGPVRPRSLRP